MSESLDAIAPSFRRAVNRWPDAPNLQAHYADLARTFEENGSSLLELTKSFVEMVCITVVTELGNTPPTSGTTTECLGAALDALGLRQARGSSALGKIISAHNKLADGLGEARNNDGSVAHGKDAFVDAISDRHGRVYLLSADTILSLVLTVYDDVEPSVLHTREPHSRYQHYNDRINGGTVVDAEVDEDGAVVLSFRAGDQRPGEGFELRVSTSELLYYLDRPAYMDVLNALRGMVPVGEEEEVDEAEHAVEAELSVVGVGADTDAKSMPPTKPSPANYLAPVTEYDGQYADKVHPLYDHIIHHLLAGDDKQAAQVLNFIYTLLTGMEDLGVVDWSKFDSTRSRVRVLVKKLFVLFSIDGMGREAIDDIVVWLADHIDGV